MTNQTTSEQSRAVVDAYYQAGVQAVSPISLRTCIRTSRPRRRTISPGRRACGSSLLPRRSAAPSAGRARLRAVQLRRSLCGGRACGGAGEFRHHRQRRDHQDLRALDRHGRQGHLHLGRLFRASGFARQARHRPRPRPPRDRRYIEALPLVRFAEFTARADLPGREGPEGSARRCRPRQGRAALRGLPGDQSAPGGADPGAGGWHRHRRGAGDHALSRRGLSRKAPAGRHAQGQGPDRDVGATRRAGRLRGGDGGRAQQDCRG